MLVWMTFINKSHFVCREREYELQELKNVMENEKRTRMAEMELLKEKVNIYVAINYITILPNIYIFVYIKKYLLMLDNS